MKHEVAARQAAAAGRRRRRAHPTRNKPVRYQTQIGITALFSDIFLIPTQTNDTQITKNKNDHERKFKKSAREWGRVAPKAAMAAALAIRNSRPFVELKLDDRKCNSKRQPAQCNTKAIHFHKTIVRSFDLSFVNNRSSTKII
jgi:hypothetical protein